MSRIHKVTLLQNICIKQLEIYYDHCESFACTAKHEWRSHISRSVPWNRISCSTKYHSSYARRLSRYCCIPSRYASRCLTTLHYATKDNAKLITISAMNTTNVVITIMLSATEYMKLLNDATRWTHTILVLLSSSLEFIRMEMLLFAAMPIQPNQSAFVVYAQRLFSLNSPLKSSLERQSARSHLICHISSRITLTFTMAM